MAVCAVDRKYGLLTVSNLKGASLSIRRHSKLESLKGTYSRRDRTKSFQKDEHKVNEIVVKDIWCWVLFLLLVLVSLQFQICTEPKYFNVFNSCILLLAVLAFGSLTLYLIDLLTLWTCNLKLLCLVHIQMLLFWNFTFWYQWND